MPRPNKRKSRSATVTFDDDDDEIQPPEPLVPVTRYHQELGAGFRLRGTRHAVDASDGLNEHSEMASDLDDDNHAAGPPQDPGDPPLPNLSPQPYAHDDDGIPYEVEIGEQFNPWEALIEEARNPQPHGDTNPEVLPRRHYGGVAESEVSSSPHQI